MRLIGAALILCLISATAEARVVRLRVDRREPVLNSQAFGLAGPYEKLMGTVEFAVLPSLRQNQAVVDLDLAPRNAQGEVEFSADFYLLKPVDMSRGNGRLLYEVGNRGGKSTLTLFQKAKGSSDPGAAEEFGDGALMRQGFSLLWMGWQWDVPAGRMRMQMPVASNSGRPILGLVRGNFVPNQRSATAPLADRAHQAYAVLDPADRENFMTVRDLPLDPPQRVPRERWRFVDGTSVTLDGGFEPGRIYDVVYRSSDPKVLGCGLAGTRDLISFLKYSTLDANPLRGTKIAYGWGASQSGRFLRHLLYEGFNEDEEGRRVFDGVIDHVGGAGRGSFNHRFGQASRDAEQHLNIFYPVDMFPFTDGPATDPENGRTDALLARADARGVRPKLFHILSNSEYFNRAGSLIHTDPAGVKDIEPPADVRIYLVSSAPHYSGRIPPSTNAGGDLEGQAALNPVNSNPVVRAMFQALDRWVAEGVAPPPSRYPHLSDGTLGRPEALRWPKIPAVPLPPPMIITYRLDFGPQWNRGIVSYEPPRVGRPFQGLVPAVDADGLDRAGVRLPEIQVPLGTYGGWNYRPAKLGAPTQLAGEAGSFHPFARSRAERESNGDSRLSIEERYAGRDQYLGKIAAAARSLIADGFMLPQDLPELLDRSLIWYDWATHR